MAAQCRPCGAVVASTMPAACSGCRTPVLQMCACACACVRACVRVCVRACVYVRAVCAQCGVVYFNIVVHVVWRWWWECVGMCVCARACVHA